MKRPSKIDETIPAIGGRKVRIRWDESRPHAQIELTGPQGVTFSAWLTSAQGGQLHRLLALAFGLGLAIALGG